MIYTKYAGIIFILAASCYAGYMQGKKQKEQIEVMESFKRCFMIIRDEINFAGTPLPVLFEKVGRMEYEVGHSFFEAMAEKMNEENNDEMSDEAADNMWMKACEELKILEAMKHEDKMILKRAGNILGAGNVNSQINTINLHISNITSRIEHLKKNVYERVKLCHVLGVATGLFLAILII